MRYGLRERRGNPGSDMRINGMRPLPMDARLALIRLIDVAENWDMLTAPRGLGAATAGKKHERAGRRAR